MDPSDLFRLQHGTLCAEDVPLTRVAEAHGTPTYLYSRAAITHNANDFRLALGSLPHTLHYSVKTNSNLAVLQLLHTLGCSFEAVSGGDFARVQRVLSTASRNGSLLTTTAETTILSGVGKTDEEIATALKAGVRYICVESAEELWAVRDIAAAQNIGPAPVGVRINPDVDAHTHPHIATGLKGNKFGIAAEDAVPLLKQAHGDPHLRIVAISCHIGSQITTLEPFYDAASRLAEVARTLLAAGIPLKYVGMGGGLGIKHKDETPPPAQEYGQVLADVLGPLGLEILLEPGRVIVGNAGVLLSRVVRTKENGGRRFVILDAGMTELMRPALYGAYHTITPVSPSIHTRPQQKQHIVGPVCESSDIFAKDRLLPRLETGDLVILRSAGAYGFTMASNFNNRARPAEVMVHGDQMLLVRERERVSDLWRGESGLDGQAPCK